MDKLLSNVILPGILWDIIKGGAKISKVFFKISKVFLKKLLRNENFKKGLKEAFEEVLQDLEQKSFSSKRELKNELQVNTNYENLRKIIFYYEKGRCQQRALFKRKQKNCLTIVIIVFVAIICVGSQRNSPVQSILYWRGEISDSSNYGGGSGTVNDPYLINEPGELAELSYMVQAGIDYKNTYFKLNRDLYLNDFDNKGAIKVKNSNLMIINSNLKRWVAIGSRNHPFCGYFDGNHKSIHGLYIEGNDAYQGLFGNCTSKSTIVNLSIEEAIICITDGDFVGGICGEMDGLLDGCFLTKGVVNGGFCVGGIVGKGNIVVNCGSAAYIGDSNNLHKNYDELVVNIEALSSKGCIGGIAGKCNFLINSVSYSRIENPTYRAGNLAGEVVFDIYNCVCSQTMIEFSFFDKFFSALKENNMAFEYGEALGIFDGKGNNVIDNHCVYGTEGAGSIFIVPVHFEKQQFRELYSDIPINGSDDDLGYVIDNFDYSAENQSYNTITERLICDKNTVKKFNDNINLELYNWHNSDIEEVLMEYGVGGGGLQLRKWIYSEKHEVPTLEGMNIEHDILYLNLTSH